jgi:hypothetical protein
MGLCFKAQKMVLTQDIKNRARDVFTDCHSSAIVDFVATLGIMDMVNVSDYEDLVKINL